MKQQSQKVCREGYSHSQRNSQKPPTKQQIIQKDKKNEMSLDFGNNDMELQFQNCHSSLEQNEGINKFKSLQLSSYDKPKFNKCKSNIKNVYDVDPWAQNFYQVIQYVQQIESNKANYQSKKRKLSNLTQTNFNPKLQFSRNDNYSQNYEHQKIPRLKYSIKNLENKVCDQKYEFSKIETTDEQKLKWKLQMEIMMRKRKRLSHLLKARQFGHMKINSQIISKKQCHGIQNVTQIKFKKYINEDDHKKIYQNLETEQQNEFIYQQNQAKKQQTHRSNSRSNKFQLKTNIMDSSTNIQPKSPLLSSSMIKTLSKFIKENENKKQNTTNIYFYNKSRPQARFCTQRSISTKYVFNNESMAIQQKNKSYPKHFSKGKKSHNNIQLTSPLEQKNQRIIRNISFQNQQIRKNQRLKANFMAKKKSNILIQSSYLGYLAKNKPKETKSLGKQTDYANNKNTQNSVKIKIIQHNRQILQIKPKLKIKINHYAQKSK